MWVWAKSALTEPNPTNLIWSWPNLTLLRLDPSIPTPTWPWPRLILTYPYLDRAHLSPTLFCLKCTCPNVVQPNLSPTRLEFDPTHPNLDLNCLGLNWIRSNLDSTWCGFNLAWSWPRLTWHELDHPSKLTWVWIWIDKYFLCA